MLDQYQLLIGYLLLFVGVGVGFIFVHLIIGKLIRPAKPEAEKLTIYECGEPTIGSAWIQFDLRFYVVALLFVIFDVEVAFFFPWAVVFGHATQLAEPTLSGPERVQLVKELVPPYPETRPGLARLEQHFLRRDELAKEAGPALQALGTKLGRSIQSTRDLRSISNKDFTTAVTELDPKHRELLEELDRLEDDVAKNESAAESLAWLSFVDIVVFFGVLLVGFAYLWKRGDLDWVRSFAAERAAAPGAETSPADELVSTR